MIASLKSGGSGAGQAYTQLADEGVVRVALAGNPNVGKSIFFNYLTGVYVSVSNYPGTTLEISEGKYRDYLILDTPGVYGVSSFNDEEAVARDVIISADIVINVVDAVHLERDLFLTQQIIDMGIPVIIALNMMDEARGRGLKIDLESLSKELGVPVIPTIATREEGLGQVARDLDRAGKGNKSFSVNSRITEELQELSEKTGNIPEALLIYEGDRQVAGRYQLEPGTGREGLYRRRRQRVNEVVDRVVSLKQKDNSLNTRLGRLLLQPLTGVPVLLFIMWVLYKFIGVFVAQTIVDFTEGQLLVGIYEPFIRKLVGHLVTLDSLPGHLLVGEFGLLTMAVTYTFGLLLPLVAGFYFFLALLEDSGYMPRLAALVDRLLTSIGLNGRAIIPMLLGFGCVTMATITTRMLGSRRERIIATFLLGLAIPCSAQLGVIAGLIAPLGMDYFLLYLLVITGVYVLAGTFLNRVLPGESTDLLIDLPPLRWPLLKNVFQKTYIKSKSFIREAGPVFALGAVIITLMEQSRLLEGIQGLVAPITVGWLKLPAEASTAFIMGIIRRDFGAAGLNSLTLTPLQTTIALITITLFVPCLASMMIMLKERNLKEAIMIWIGSWVTAFGVGGLIAQIF